MYKLDLHTHSQASPDGGLRAKHYRQMLDSGRLNYIAVTDHNTIEFAQALHTELGERIIVGEEITAIEGEIIGLFLKRVVSAGLSAEETVAAIRKQGGVVYIPHPFETIRKGLPESTLKEIVGKTDIIETYNGRAVFQNKGDDAKHWATMHGISEAASSDAHGWRGWGNTYSVIDEAPTANNLARLLERATYDTGNVGWRGLVYPKLNRLRKMSR